MCTYIARAPFTILIIFLRDGSFTIHTGIAVALALWIFYLLSFCRLKVLKFQWANATAILAQKLLMNPHLDVFSFGKRLSMLHWFLDAYRRLAHKRFGGLGLEKQWERFSEEHYKILIWLYKLLYFCCRHQLLNNRQMKTSLADLHQSFIPLFPCIFKNSLMSIHVCDWQTSLDVSVLKFCFSNSDFAFILFWKMVKSNRELLNAWLKPFLGFTYHNQWY